MSLAGPEPVSTNPLQRLARDWRDERKVAVPFPRGDTNFSRRRPLPALRTPLRRPVDAYERHGPVFTLRLFHGNVVFMLGPEANHYMLVSHFNQFSWREGHLGDMIPLLGDGLLTIDGDFHKRSRRIMLPAFHSERIAALTTLMEAEIEQAVGRWQLGQVLDLYGWTRHLALRIAMRALFGVDPDGGTAARMDAAQQFETALGFWAEPYIKQTMRGPGTPFARLRRARRELDQLIYSEINRRRA